MTVKIDLEESKWTKLPRDQNRVLDMIAHRLNKSRKTLVITGAGISCNAGIPDFRSKDGLYNMVKHQHPNVVVKGKDLFDSIVFSEEKSAAVFYTFMAELRRCMTKAKPTAAHRFIKTLQSKQKLLRCYTQNIDGLESHVDLSIGGSLSLTDSKTISAVSERLGDSPKKPTKTAILKHLDVIQLHGDIHTLKCTCCSESFDWLPEITKTLVAGESPECPSCVSKSNERLARGMRSTAIGGLRPNIVLYGEEHPHGDIIGTCIAKDAQSKPDIMLVIGTTMKVVGLKKLVRDVAKSMKQGTANKKPEQHPLIVLVNKTDIGLGSWTDIIDYHIKCDCDEWIKDLKTRVPDLFAIQTKIDEFTTNISSENPKTTTTSIDLHDANNLPPVTAEVQTPSRRTRSSTKQEMAMLLTPSSTPRKRKAETAEDISLLTPPQTRSTKRSRRKLSPEEPVSVVPIDAYPSPFATPSKRGRGANNKKHDEIFNDIDCPQTASRLLFSKINSQGAQRGLALDDCAPIKNTEKRQRR